MGLKDVTLSWIQANIYNINIIVANISISLFNMISVISVKITTIFAWGRCPGFYIQFTPCRALAGWALRVARCPHMR